MSEDHDDATPREDHGDGVLHPVRMFLRSFRPTDGPGYTDYPEVDIRAHRANARVMKWGGVGIGLLGLWYGVSNWSAQILLVVVTFVLLCFWAETDLRLKALEWEVELNNDE